MIRGYDAVRPSAWDSARRLEDQDVDGVSGEVIYPSLAMSLYGIADGRLRAACFRAYNDWLAEYCGYAPRRLAGAPLIPMDDVTDAIAEIERAGAHRLGGERRRLDPPLPAAHRSLLGSSA